MSYWKDCGLWTSSGGLFKSLAISTSENEKQQHLFLATKTEFSRAFCWLYLKKQTNRQTDRQTNKQTNKTREFSLQRSGKTSKLMKSSQNLQIFHSTSQPLTLGVLGFQAVGANTGTRNGTMIGIGAIPRMVGRETVNLGAYWFLGRSGSFFRVYVMIESVDFI